MLENTLTQLKKATRSAEREPLAKLFKESEINPHMLMSIAQRYLSVDDSLVRFLVLEKTMQPDVPLKVRDKILLQILNDADLSDSRLGLEAIELYAKLNRPPDAALALLRRRIMREDPHGKTDLWALRIIAGLDVSPDVKLDAIRGALDRSRIVDKTAYPFRAEAMRILAGLDVSPDVKLDVAKKEVCKDVSQGTISPNALPLFIKLAPPDVKLDVLLRIIVLTKGWSEDYPLAKKACDELIVPLAMLPCVWGWQEVHSRQRRSEWPTDHWGPSVDDTLFNLCKRSVMASGAIPPAADDH